MPTITAPGGGTQPNSANLSTAQTGNGQSTNIADRGSAGHRTSLVRITTTIGATPTVTIAIEVSADAANWWQVIFADSATPSTFGFATFVMTTATTVQKLIQVDQPWRYIRLTYSANTNVTTTADVFTF